MFFNFAQKIQCKTVLFILALGMILTITCCYSKASADAIRYRTITDLAGRQVRLPVEVKRVACLEGNSYERVFLLSEADKIAVRILFDGPWAERLNPRLKDIYCSSAYNDPNIEELLSRQVDVVLYWDYPKQLAKLEECHIPVVVTQKTMKKIRNSEELVEYLKQEMRMYGKVLGPKAEKKATEWCAYFDQKTRWILARTSKIPEKQRPKVYYVRGPDALTTHGGNSNTYWFVEMAGGNFITKNMKQGGQVTMEELIQWDPDVVFMGRVGQPDLILKDPKWQHIAAVRNNRVYATPNGVRSWDSGGEAVLFIEYMAQKMYPDLFKDLNMTDEVKNYYWKFYKYHLSDNEAIRLLQGLGPEGN
ncbi:MAG TPA: iron ABC transporter substrate-binding protein [Firmicutes bacterium]|jgi:iron complex transport system substrate-binding protein|nr:iron ABC transporter substrate-binding protein [Bacillota bacterium]